MKQRWGLEETTCCDRHLEIPGVLNNTIGTLEQKKTNSWIPIGQATKKLRPQTSFMSGHHWVWHPTHRRAIKEGSKVTDSDWVKHLACRLSHYIYVMSNMFVTHDNISELIRKISPTYIFFFFFFFFFFFLNLYTYKIPVPIGLDAKVFILTSNLETNASM